MTDHDAMWVRFIACAAFASLGAVLFVHGWWLPAATAWAASLSFTPPKPMPWHKALPPAPDQPDRARERELFAWNDAHTNPALAARRGDGWSFRRWLEARARAAGMPEDAIKLWKERS